MNRKNSFPARIVMTALMVVLMVIPSLASEPQSHVLPLPPHSEQRYFDVTIYYRPPAELLDVWDWGHILLYVRNDATGEAAYFDYFPENDYSVLGAVDQARIDAHARLTIVTTVEQERKILAGIREMQQKLPDWKLRVLAVIFLGQSSTCVSRSLELLQRGGVSLKGRDPSDVWKDAWQKYSDEYLSWKQNQNIAAARSQRREKYRPGPGLAAPRADTEYGRDPQQRAGRVDPTAINNQTMYFKNGRRVK